MSVQHTPGPWAVREKSPNWEIFSEGCSRWIAYAPKAVSDEARDGTFYPSLSETAANARLIAAAPELLAACSDWIAWLDSDDWREDAADYETRMINAMRSAIAKARGETV